MAWVDRSAGLTPDPFIWWLTETVTASDIDVVYQPLGADGLAASYSNLIDPGTNDATPVVAPTFDSTIGWTFTGTQHLTTGINGDGFQTVIVRFAISPTNTSLETLTGTADVAGQSTHIAIRRSGSSPFGPNNFKYNTSVSTSGVAGFADGVLALARNKLYREGVFELTVGILDTWSEGGFLIAQIIAGGSSRFIGDIKAYAIYNRELTATEVSEISANMSAITSSDDPNPATIPVNWIIQNPSTKHLNSTSHELWAATDSGLFRTFNGGRGWAKISLPDPSNAEFGDSPAATIDELTFHWINYDRGDETILYALGAKNSVSRIWIYGATGSGINVSDWSSRGVTT